ncbi:hypothetical protein [Roseibacillus ishigakijimensis]|uniref:Uncharacterized protein n=1 Tax=Roseibacillus ishigakijimensis TaxID=454146 RepID=A0A934RRR0_9BACT|nr:hypothetical protein [Roseibacillus ishigakijimensis]MBK1834253.1 hypothetical protein [Roseibacillus ishigakijimensis]
MRRKTHPPTPQKPSGFSLVITVTLMILLSLIAVGLLSLSSSVLRSSANASTMMRAQANARLGLMIAIGELQENLGPDRRISANASSVLPDANEPELLGAWESYRWDAEAGGRPDYSGKRSLFGRWLVSTLDSENATNTRLPSGSLPNAIQLQRPSPGAGQTQSDGLRGSIVPLGTDDNSALGGYAYAVIDESQKVPIDTPLDLPEETYEEIAFRTSPPRARQELILDELDPENVASPETLVSLPTAGLATGSENILNYQGALTTGTYSLLTDVVEGGFKKDLTTAFESSNVDLADIFDRDSLYFSPDDGALRWDYLKDHYLHYRDLSQTDSGTPEKNLRSELRPSRIGTYLDPEEERLLPVISKFQLIFSMVTHYAHISERVTFFNQNGGNTNYGVPHLVYDPVITLYNPYDVALSLEQLRVRIWDPPILFGFKKNGAWLRSQHARGELHGLARFQIAYEKDPNARKYFTLFLSERDRRGSPGDPITLEPGEVRVFSPWVEDDWTWGLETGSGDYSPRAFFDWDARNEFGNIDGRTGNRLGVESIPGWDTRAGFQVDHLSYGGDRPPATLYDFERNNGIGQGGWLGIRITDTVSVVAKPGRSNANRRVPDFAIDILAGSGRAGSNLEDVSTDLVRSYTFDFNNVEEELGGTLVRPEIERTWRVRDLLQRPNDKSAGGKTPFAMLTMSAKTTVDDYDIAKPWLHNHPVVEGLAQDTGRVGNALDTYDLRVDEIASFSDAVQFEDSTGRGYYGASSQAQLGTTNVPMFRVPVTPAASLGDLIPGNLAPSSALPRVTHPLGNSRAHPLISSGSVTNSLTGGDRRIFGSGLMLDHSYLLNDALWDRTFFSTVADFAGDLAPRRDARQMLEGFFQGEESLLNSRLAPLNPENQKPEELAASLMGMNEEERVERIAGSLAIRGGFNVNSDSYEAWKAVLSSVRDQAVVSWSLARSESEGRSAFPRATLPLVDDNERINGISMENNRAWAGYRSLSDQQIEALATSIVEQIRRRGEQDLAPSLSLAEFVNRRIDGSGALHSVAGLLETAIEETGLNESFYGDYSLRVSGTDSLTPADLTGLAEPAAREGQTAEGSPIALTQGDLLMPLASFITVRGDTFRVRAYGEAREGRNGPLVRAWCEATVQRTPDYLDPADENHLSEDELTSEVNQRFGRRFRITSFRWLSEDEV